MKLNNRARKSNTVNGVWWEGDVIYHHFFRAVYCAANSLTTKFPPILDNCFTTQIV